MHGSDKFYSIEGVDRKLTGHFSFRAYCSLFDISVDHVGSTEISDYATRNFFKHFNFCPVVQNFERYAKSAQNKIKNFINVDLLG